MNLTYLESSEDVQYCFQLVNTSCPKVTRPIAMKATLYIFISFSILISIFGNLVVITSVLHFKQLQTPTNYLVLSLAFVDFLVGFIVLPSSMIRSVETCWYFGNVFCKIHSILDIVLTIVSIYNICFIAVDRYYALCDPLLYSLKITLPVTIVTLTLIWLFAIFYGFSVFLSDFSKKALDNYIPTMTFLDDVITWFGFFNSTLNPMLTPYLYPWYRKVLKLIFSCEIFSSDSATIDFFSE
ncbi:trace amine-associated receptor 3-like [Pristis pectinata]|uniref:trace amine-associated receptor 3-like n=1 Tax=Pristis pectinata TaxID=685728 RepID=UPI00223D4416|nr:trace amine-associated receptor 3-like [Pristis pectinata]